MFKNFQMHARGSFRDLQNTISLTLSSSGLLMKFVACLGGAGVSKVRGEKKRKYATQIFCCGQHSDDPKLPLLIHCHVQAISTFLWAAPSSWVMMARNLRKVHSGNITGLFQQRIFLLDISAGCLNLSWIMQQLKAFPVQTFLHFLLPIL